MRERLRLRPLALATTLIVAWPVSLAAQSEDGDPLGQALAANCHTLELVDGRLRGAGGELLLEAGRAGRFPGGLLPQWRPWPTIEREPLTTPRSESLWPPRTSA